MIEPINLKPFTKFCCTIGTLPSSYIVSLSYEEQLWWLCDYLKNTVIPSINNNAEALKEVQELYNQLFDFLSHLDLQDEINNKLDEMGESGQLQEIISIYLNSQSIIAFNNISELKQAENIGNNSFVKTYGYYSYNDNGGAFYKIRNKTNEDVPNDKTIIALNNPNLVAEFLNINPYIIPEQLGAKGDGENDDFASLQSAINLNNVKLSRKSYYTSEPIQIPNDRTLDGNNGTLISAFGKFALISIGNGISSPKVQISIKDLKINTSKNGGNGIRIKDGYFIYIDNVNISQLNQNNAIGFEFENGFNINVKNSRVLGNLNNEGQIGLNLYTAGDQIANATNNKYDTLLLQNLDYGVKTNYTVTANTVIFENLGFSNCLYAFYLEGFALPLSINNTRMESTLENSLGFFIGQNIEASIYNLNAYNIPNVIKTLSIRTLMLLGSIALTGTPKNPLYNFVDPESTGQIINLAQFTTLSNVYKNNANLMLSNNEKIGNTITGNTINIENTSIYTNKITNSISNIYGQKGSKIRVWTDQNNIVLNGKNNSDTNKWNDNITLEPYKIYTIFMVEKNQCAIFN